MANSTMETPRSRVVPSPKWFSLCETLLPTLFQIGRLQKTVND
jgi:hypothetical protein